MAFYLKSIRQPKENGTAKGYRQFDFRRNFTRIRPFDPRSGWRSNLKILDVGCGLNKLPGSVGLDIVPLEGVDVVHDLNQFPYPFEANTFDGVRIIHVIEHIQSIPRTMEEVHRISKPGAQVQIVTPHHSDASSWQDPTHIWHLNSRSFDCFEDTSITSYYSKARFKVVRCEVKVLKLFKLLGFEFLINLQNRHPRYRSIRKFWEQYLCYIVRGKVMHFSLQVLK
ncbi:MAG: methyltransferase domain-containing protein [Acidobacteriota bacterium]